MGNSHLSTLSSKMEILLKFKQKHHQNQHKNGSMLLKLRSHGDTYARLLKKINENNLNREIFNRIQILLVIFLFFSRPIIKWCLFFFDCIKWRYVLVRISRSG